jgi:hypothetical protein
VAVLGRGDDRGGGQLRLPEPPHVGVEVYRARHAAREQAVEVVPRVVERRLKRGAHGRGDEPGDRVSAERVDLEAQGREGGRHDGPEPGGRRRAAALRVERHGDVHQAPAPATGAGHPSLFLYSGASANLGSPTTTPAPVADPGW